MQTPMTQDQARAEWRRLQAAGAELEQMQNLAASRENDSNALQTILDALEATRPEGWKGLMCPIDNGKLALRELIQERQQLRSVLERILVSTAHGVGSTEPASDPFIDFAVIETVSRAALAAVPDVGEPHGPWDDATARDWYQIVKEQSGEIEDLKAEIANHRET